jgi:hypothetical protein
MKTLKRYYRLTASMALFLFLAVIPVEAQTIPNRMSLAISGGASMGAYEAGLIWGLVAVFLSRGRMTHPDVLQPWEGLDRRRSWTAWGAILVFFLCFSPVPIGF